MTTISSGAFGPQQPFQAAGDHFVGNSAPARVAFSADYQNPKIRAAGALPYAFHGNKTYVLLSEHDSSDEKHACNTDVYEGFGGFIEKGSTPVKTVFEELREESKTLFDLSYETVDKHGMVVFEQQNTYLQLLLRVEYDPALPALFRSTIVHHVSEKEIDEKNVKLGPGVQIVYVDEPMRPCPDSIYSPFREKIDVRWIPLEDLIHDLRYVEYSVVKDKNGKDTRVPHCALYDKDRDENLHLRPAFIATMLSLVDAAPEIVAQVINQTITDYNSPVVVTSRQ